MAKRSAIPEDNREYPEYEYREFPKYVGGDQYGQPLIAQRPEDVAGLEALKVYPKAVGRNRDGKTVFANSPDEVELRMGEVVQPIEEAASAASKKAQETTTPKK